MNYVLRIETDLLFIAVLWDKIAAPAETEKAFWFRFLLNISSGFMSGAYKLPIL